MVVRIPMTVAQARELNGPGTQIHWRPNTTRVSAEPDTDRAYVLHVSDAEDVEHARLARERESKLKVKY